MKVLRNKDTARKLSGRYKIRLRDLKGFSIATN
jgi:hypothetical protein